MKQLLRGDLNSYKFSVSENYNLEGSNNFYYMNEDLSKNLSKFPS